MGLICSLGFQIGEKMKSRSHQNRLPTMDTPDWVNGSWTVDCLCGVNFDDGEEMVDCDECGVWVHTKCSHYVKSEKSFSCNKCKNRSSGNECEETEVAQLLVDLPTKTLRMDSNHNAYPSRGPPHGPIRLWTQRPMEERVHVQGIPGGEPSLFGGLSSIFTPELWKCTGHVPKKFNFKYREFPCWDQDQPEEENENPVDKGAGVLFSLSKDVLAGPVVNFLLPQKGRVEGGACEKVAASEDSKKFEVANMNVRLQQKDFQKDGTLLRPFVFHSGKRKKDDLETSKDQSVKKKVRLIHKERDSKKRATKTSMTDSATPSNTKDSVFDEARGPKIVNIDNQGAKALTSDTVQDVSLSGDDDVMKNNVDKSNENLASSEKPQENNAFDVSGQSLSTGAGQKEEKGVHQVHTRTKDSTRTDNGMTSFMIKGDPGIISSTEEAVGSGIDNVDDSERWSPISSEGGPKKSETFVEKSISPILEVIDSKNCPERPSNHNDEVKSELGAVSNLVSVESSTLGDVKIVGPRSYVQHVESTSGDHLNSKTDSTTVTSLQPPGLKALADDTSAVEVGKCQTDVAEKFLSDHSQPIRQAVGSERATSAGRNSADVKLNMRVNNALPSKVSSKNAIPQPPSTQHKITDYRRPSDSKRHNSKTGISDSNSNRKKDKDRHETSDNNVKKDRDRLEMHRKILKEHPKSSLGSVLRASHSGKVSQVSEAKRTSDSKLSAGGSSSKPPSAQNHEVTSGSGELTSSLENKNLSQVHSKISSSGSSLRGEKGSQSNNNSALMNLPAQSNSTAILSDEELALLLHQELNSSPRVPRVPRMRSAGTIPQLGSPTSAATLIKRTSSSGGRDQSLVAKKKGKDSPKQGSHSSRDTDDETKDRFPLSPDQRNNKSSRAMDALPKREGDNAGKGSHTVKKSAIPLSPTTVSRPFSPSAVSETKSGSTRHPLPNSSDDDAGTNKGLAHQTLPGLLAEIMGKGKRMTYEELCNEVLPHWPHLRKHNGERYAYSTHSQAVLDCLRNRQEWAQLVDRGPKQTNGFRKRRKHDIETAISESEDNEYIKDPSAKEVESSLKSHREDVPKGKRKARKRRRLPLRGRRVKDVRRGCKTDSDDRDDNGSSSSSTEDSMYSDDEIHGDDTCQNGSEGGTSSDEAGTRL